MVAARHQESTRKKVPTDLSGHTQCLKHRKEVLCICTKPLLGEVTMEWLRRGALNNPRCKRKSSAPNIEEPMGWCAVYSHAVNDAVEIRLCNMLRTSAHDSAFESLCCSVWESDELPQTYRNRSSWPVRFCHCFAVKAIPARAFSR